MSLKELMEEHVQKHCKGCKEECDGIRLTVDNKTKCNRDVKVNAN